MTRPRSPKAASSRSAARAHTRARGHVAAVIEVVGPGDVLAVPAVDRVEQAELAQPPGAVLGETGNDPAEWARSESASTSSRMPSRWAMWLCVSIMSTLSRKSPSKPLARISRGDLVGQDPPQAGLRDVGEPFVLPVGPGAEAVALDLRIPGAPLLDRADAEIGEHGRALRSQRRDLIGGRQLAVDNDEVVDAEPLGDLVRPAGEVAVADREGEAGGRLRVAGVLPARPLPAPTAIAARPMADILRTLMRVFLTGGTGFIGGHVARKLRERGDDVRALVRSPREGRGARGARLRGGRGRPLRRGRDRCVASRAATR